MEAARAMGAPRRTVVGRYVFFNVVQSVPVIFTVNAADAILTLAALGFLGYGVPIPAAEWGYDISRAIGDVANGFWWTSFFPGMFILLLVTGLTLLGEGINDIINPLLRRRGVGVGAVAPGAVVVERGATVATPELDAATVGGADIDDPARRGGGPRTDGAGRAESAAAAAAAVPAAAPAGVGTVEMLMYSSSGLRELPDSVESLHGALHRFGQVNEQLSYTITRMQVVQDASEALQEAARRVEVAHDSVRQLAEASTHIADMADTATALDAAAQAARAASQELDEGWSWHAFRWGMFWCFIAVLLVLGLYTWAQSRT